MKFSKNDILVLNDLIKEINTYSNVLMKNNFINESKKLVSLGIKISDNLITNINKNENNKENMKFLLYLKLSLLENKFNIIFNFDQRYEESEIILLEIINIQNIIQVHKFHLGCSIFYSALIKFCKKIKINFSFKWY